MQKTLTDILIRSVAPPSSGRLELSDTRCQGLQIRVTSSGAKSWSFRFRDPRSGRVTRATIGPYPEVTLAKARERAGEMRKTVAAGKNPVQEKRREREEASTKTFQALADRYLDEHARRRKRSADCDERNLRLHVLPTWANRRYDEIRRSDVIALCEGLLRAGTLTNSNRVQALISSIFSFAVDADLLEANPCFRLRKRSVETVGTRVLADSELPLFWHGIVCKPVSRSVGLALRIALLTGVRAGEIAGAYRTEFRNLNDPDRAEWVIPPDRSKNGREHLVPLTGLALESTIKALELAGDESPFLFPSPSVADKPITAHALAVAMARFAKELQGQDKVIKSWKAEPPTPHDLRRTAATRLSSLGVPAQDVAAILNHTRRDVTGAHYDKYDRAREKRQALSLWSETVKIFLKPVAEEISSRKSMAA